MPLSAPTGFTFGADPELFILDANGIPVSAAGLIPGTKEEPFKVDGGAVQVDGMAAEFNIDPSISFMEFDSNIRKVMAALKKMLPKGHYFSSEPSVAFSQEVFDAAPEEAKVLGCTPDYNAWTEGMNEVPDTSHMPTLRCAGGHLHVGWDEDLSVLDETHINNCFDLVKQLDWYLAAWSVKADPDTLRRSLYGKAGACRIKPYGVEYRVLSNFWIWTESRRVAVWDRAVRAILDMPKAFMPDTAAIYGEKLVEMINTSVRNKDIEYLYKYPVGTINRSW